MRLTSGGEATRPVWTPDGQRIAFWWLQRGRWQLTWVRADGVGEPEVLATGVGAPAAWSPDGRRLLLVQGGDIWVATVGDGPLTQAPLLKSPALEQWPAVSPDGKWLAYGSNATGRDEVYVQSFPTPGPRLQVSLEGGTAPVWNPDGRELLYVSRDEAGQQSLMAAGVRFTPSLAVERPRRLFSSEISLTGTLTRPFSLSPDGQLLYVTQPIDSPPLPPVTHVELIQNWTEELTARVVAGATSSN
jgi:Tol biopolymer transport system component